MLEGLVTWVLNNYVGEYLENLNADQLSIALLQGQVELENVPLRKTALRKFDIPLQVRSGIIGKLTLSIPMTHMRSEPWILKMSDLLILLGPSDGVYDASDVEGYELTKKEQMLEALENEHKKQLLLNLGLPFKDDTTQNQYWGASVFSAVSNNIQLILSNVHIRYEDDKTMPDNLPFNFGIRIQHISIQTTNSQWKPEFVQPQDGVNTFKKLDIKGFSVFWNCHQPVISKIETLTDLKNIMSPENSKNNSFILQPFSMQVRMEKNSSKFPLKTIPAIPRFKIDLRPEKINIELSKKQLAQIRLLTREWTRFDRARQHRKWRPLMSIKNNPSEWWKFAIGRILEEAHQNRQRSSKKFLLTRAKHLNGYCKSYKQKLEAYLADQVTNLSATPTTKENTTKVSAMSAIYDDTTFMKQIEHDSQFTYHELHLFRETVFRRMIREKTRGKNQSKNDDNESNSDANFELVSPDTDGKKIITDEVDVNPDISTNQGGLYNWFTGWFSSGNPNEEKADDDDINEANFLQMWPNIQERDLPPNLKRVERKIEEEILDVLNESWDDSTILRRDNLLAEIVLRLERMIIRFVDEELNGSSRVVAMDMRQVVSRFQLSPREHRTEISLSVGDMSVQRLKISPNFGKDDEKSDITSFSSEDIEDEEESLVFGFGSIPKVAPQLLFAIGRAREDSGDNGLEITEKVENLIIMTEGEQKSKKPLFQMIYRRMAPRLNVLHELDAKFAPVSVIYDEDAVNGLANLFDTESAIFEKKIFDDDFTGLESVGETQCFLNFSIPFVLVELRSRRTSLSHNIPEPISSPFACAKITNVDIGISKNEPLLTKLKISLSSLIVDDLYEKTSTMPLIRTVDNSKSLTTMTSLSSSCPDLHDEIHRFTTLSSSLPEILEFKPVFNNNPQILPESHLQSHIPRKNTIAKYDNDFGIGNPDRPLLNFIFVDSKHPEFESKYSKKTCIIDGEFSGIDVAMNRRSWTMLLDFFGVLGVKTEKQENEPDQVSLSGIDEKYLELLYGKDAANDIKIQNELSNAKILLQNPTNVNQKKEDYLMHLNLTIGTGRVFMTYPKNQTQLGMLISNTLELDVKINIANPLEPMLMRILTTELFLHDTTPFYSRFYSERMSMKSREHQNSENNPKIEIDVLKYRTNDPDLKRDCDMKMKITATESFDLHYIHTHRFFCGLMDFWFNFAELQDSVRKMNEEIVDIEECQKMRTKIDLNLFGGLTLILPLNQFSDQTIILEMGKVEITNLFQLASRTKELTENCVDNKCLNGDYDCLLEKMMINCQEISIHEGYRISVDKINENEYSNDFKMTYNKKIGNGFFQNYYFLMDEKGILTRKYDLHVDVFKNLSSFISHNVPELIILSKFDNTDLVFTTDFYCLLRGFLEKNLGEQLIPIAETVPIEILQNPEKGFIASTSEKYLTLSFRLSFENVEIHFKVPESAKFPRYGRFKKFGKVGLHKARISFDAFIDSISEFDLICESTELIDTRFEDSDLKENIFPLILQSRTKETPTNSSLMKLMSEAHIMMKKDEAPIITLVLQNSRIILILDWLNNAKDFFLLNTTFVPPEEPTTMKYGFGTPKEGIITRIPDSKNECLQNLHTITLKITLRDSDLILLEEPKNKDSLSLFCFTTCVLNLNDRCGIFEGNLEIQKMCLSWSVLSNEDLTKCQISNDFSITINLQKDVKTLKESAAELLQTKEIIQNSNNSVTKIFETILPKQKMSIEMSEVVARVSYKDILVLKSVLEGSLSRLQSSFENSMIPKRNELPGKPPFVIQKVFFNSNHLCLWFLDDSQGIALPILRLVLSDVHFELLTDERITLKLQLAIDYFNQRVFGWEPFIETWKIDELTFRWKKYHLNMVLQPAIDSPLDFNVTNTLIQHAKHFLSKWTTIKTNLDRDFRNLCTRSRADHLPYLLKNETGTNLLFTTNVDEVLRSRTESRKSTAKWFSATAGKSCTFEFPTKRLIAKEKVNEPRQLIVRVEGWDEISPVDVDSVGTYFRVTKMNSTTIKKDPPRARVVVAVTMDPDGRKVVTIRSALLTVNQLPDAILLKFSNRLITNAQEIIEIKLEAGGKLSVPLKFVNAEMEFMPCSPLTPVGSQQVDWRSAKVPGDIVNQTLKFHTNDPGKYYWTCVSVKREHYPEYELLSGHTIVFIPPMTLLNLLPVEMQFIIGDNQKYSVEAGGRQLIMDIDLNQEMKVSVRTEQFKSVKSVFIQRSNYAERGITEDKKIDMQMIDGMNRLLNMYGSIYVTRGSALHLSIWVPYWIVNRSGIPMIIKQEATENDAAGQFQDHERAKDRNPLMFSFSDINCPQACTVRVGNKFERDPDYKPQYCRKFELSSGVQAIKLLLTHEQQATLMYDVGIEVRQCTGRYKDTQVVLFTPRYRLNNQSSTQLFVCHQEDIKKPSQHVPLATQCNLIWHETFEDEKRLCVKRSDVEHWSCPFRLDQIGSFHVTMRNRDETPQFVRVEVALSGASFWVTFTDSIYFPAPIEIRNFSNVPVLYQQSSKEFNRFRTICKANSTVDYSWDDLYGEKLLTLQVYENKSHSYDPSKPKRGPALIYENYLYIQFLPSFQRNLSSNQNETLYEEKDLVLEALVNGKVVLNSLNIADSSQRQLWKFSTDGSFENVGMNHTAKQGERFVLDVLEASGFALMVVNRTETRNITQKWRFTNDGRLCCGLKDMYVENIGRSKVILTRPKKELPKTNSNIPVSQNFIMQHQKPGSGILDVECLHVGPTLVVQITDRMEPNSNAVNSGSSRSSRSPTRNGTILSQRITRTRQDSLSMLSTDLPWNFDAEIQLPSGIGISVINLHNEELIYARFQGVQMHLCRIETTYQITGHVSLIQIDNQLLTTEKWPILYCQVNALKDVDDNSDPSMSLTDINIPIRPALKLEMNCTPKEHYDAFDCFRLKLCDMCVLLDETLLWKICQFIQETDSADVVSQSALLQPPNIEPDMNVPGTSDGTPTRRCYFGTLDLEVGNVALTVITVAKNGLPKDLQLLKRQFNIKLVSFENAFITLSSFRQFHYFETMKFLVASLSKFYSLELQKQTVNIIFTMDAFGNPRGLATDLKESFQSLIFELEIGSFVAGVGYGVTNSLSKVASSMSHGIGSLTYDEQHELMRKRLLRMQPQSEGNAALSHLCNGVKGLGVGVLGGVFAMYKNTARETEKDGFSGIFKGIAKGAVDTVTKPVQGVFDLLEGTASAVKEVVGNQQLRKSRFPDQHVRLPRVCNNLQLLLPRYSSALAEAQQELLRINGYTNSEALFDMEIILRKKTHDNIEQRVLICSDQCYCLRQINGNPASVVQTIAYRYFKNIYIDSTTNVGKGLICIAVAYDSNQESMKSPRLVCDSHETARRLCEKILRAKQLYDHSKRTLAVKEDFDNLQI